MDIALRSIYVFVALSDTFFFGNLCVVEQTVNTMIDCKKIRIMDGASKSEANVEAP